MVGEYQRASDRYQMVTVVLGALSVLLGLASAVSAVSAWLAVIATVMASITAHVKNQRYQVLIGAYQSTATRLEILKDQWADSGKTDGDKADRDVFIQRCEETIAVENGAWVAQWTELSRPRTTESGDSKYQAGWTDAGGQAAAPANS